MVPDPNERDVAALHSIIAKRFRAALMTCGELFLGEESFRERLDKRRGNVGCFLAVGHSESSCAGIGRPLNKNDFMGSEAGRDRTLRIPTQSGHRLNEPAPS